MTAPDPNFALHPDLVRDGYRLGAYDLCEVLMIDDATYPWFVLVPRRVGISDTIDLVPEDHATLWEESHAFSAAIMRAYDGQKLNVAALGNMTPQLHVHHIVRYRDDAAWPGPIWGKVAMQPMTDAQIEARRATLLPHLGDGFHAA